MTVEGTYLPQTSSDGSVQSLSKGNQCTEILSTFTWKKYRAMDCLENDHFVSCTHFDIQNLDYLMYQYHCYKKWAIRESLL